MPLISSSSFQPHRLIRNQHVATLLPVFFRKVPLPFSRERIDTADGDFLDLDWSCVGSEKLVVLTHGLAGNSRKPYIMGMAKAMNDAGWDAVAWNLRSCSGEPNRLKRFYHGGDSPDLHRVILHAIQKGGYSQVDLVGFSLGGNISLRLLGEMGKEGQKLIHKAVCFSVPVDLGKSASHLSTGPRIFYMKFFLKGYRQMLREKEKRMPGTFDLALSRRCKTFYEFDRYFNAPLNGFASAEEFYERTSAVHVLNQISIPTLLVNSLDDPFLTKECYPVDAARDSEFLYLERPALGGHVGFYSFEKGGATWAENRAIRFLKGESEVSEK